MKNQVLIDWIDRSSASYEEHIRNQQHIIEAFERGAMHGWTNNQDTTVESLERARKAVEAYREGIQVMAERRAELTAEG